ncbi:hypothetical protein BH09PAT1_BH09PAT1_3220 [soil metagenome]
MIIKTKPSTLPKITSKQKSILLLLYKFRFLTTNQILKLFNHKDPHRIKEWLTDLKEKSYINRLYERKSFGENTKPAIYFLAPKARQILKTDKDMDLAELEYIYKENARSKKFIDHNLFLVDTYLFLLSQKEGQDEIKFFTKADLRRYTYFPDPMPDAFISMIGQDKTRHYFLDFFDDYTPSFVLRQRVRSYLNYVATSDWDENTESTPFPFILFICPNESMKKHINRYAKALFEKTYDDKISLFITTKTRVDVGEVGNIWQKV